MLRCVALVRTDVSEARTFLLSGLVTANVILSSLILVTLMMEAISSSKRQFLQEDTSQKTAFPKGYTICKLSVQCWHTPMCSETSDERSFRVRCSYCSVQPEPETDLTPAFAEMLTGDFIQWSQSTSLKTFCLNQSGPQMKQCWVYELKFAFSINDKERLVYTVALKINEIQLKRWTFHYKNNYATMNYAFSLTDAIIYPDST
jgi:hypothetical protein